MAEKKHESSGFTVTDRRLFTSDGDLRTENAEPAESPKPAPSAPAETVAPAVKADSATIDSGDGAAREMPPPPTAAEQDAQAAAYRESSKEVDSQVELTGRSAKEFALGDRTGVLITRVPFPAKTSSNAAVNLPSRSRIRNLNLLARSPRSIMRLRACWAVQAPVG